MRALGQGHCQGGGGRGEKEGAPGGQGAGQCSPMEAKERRAPAEGAATSDPWCRQARENEEQELRFAIQS